MVYCFMVCRFIVFWLIDLLVYLVADCLSTGLLVKAVSLVSRSAGSMDPGLCVWDDTPTCNGSWFVGADPLTLYGTTLCEVLHPDPGTWQCNLTPQGPGTCKTHAI